jgi:hypothetical protein
MNHKIVFKTAYLGADDEVVWIINKMVSDLSASRILQRLKEKTERMRLLAPCTTCVHFYNLSQLGTRKP